MGGDPLKTIEQYAEEKQKARTEEVKAGIDEMLAKKPKVEVVKVTAQVGDRFDAAGYAPGVKNEGNEPEEGDPLTPETTAKVEVTTTQIPDAPTPEAPAEESK